MCSNCYLYFNIKLLHHLELFIYCLGNKIHRSMRMIYWNLLIIRLLISGLSLLITTIISIWTRLIYTRTSWYTIIIWRWRLSNSRWLLTFNIARVSFFSSIFFSFLSLKLSYKLLLLPFKFLCFILYAL